MNDKKLPDHVEIDLSYFPYGIGPGGFSPSVMKLNAEAHNTTLYGAHEVVVKSWVIIWLLDHVDWTKIEGKRYD